MPDTPADLRAYILTVEPEQKLIELTNWDRDPGASTINVSVFDAHCAVGISDFEMQFANYNPDQTPWHKVAAWYLTMASLYESTGQQESAAVYQDRLKPYLMRRRASRSLIPRTNARTRATQVAEGSRPAFDLTVFDGISGKNKNNPSHEQPLGE